MIFCTIGVYKLVKEIGEIPRLETIFTSIAVITVSVTFKQALLLQGQPNPIINFIIGNSAILTSFVILYAGITKIRNKISRPPKRMYVYIGLVLTFIGYSLIKNKILVSVDLTIYAVIIFFIMLNILSVFSILKEKQKTLQVALMVFGITLFVDFILKSLVEVSGLPNINSVKLLSFLIRGVGALLLLVVSIRKMDIATPGKKEIAPLHSITIKFTKKIIITTVLFSLSMAILTVAVVHNVNEARKADFEEYRSAVSEDALNAGRAFRKLIIETGNELIDLASNPDIISLSESGKERLREYYASKENKVESITRMNKKGVIIFTYPYTKSIGQSIANQPHIKVLLTTHRAVLSDPIIAVQGFPAIILHIPIFNGNTFEGSLAALFNMDKLQKEVVRCRYGGEKIIIADSKNRVVSAPAGDMLFKNIATIFPQNNEDTFVRCTLGTGLVIRQNEDVFWDKMYTIYAFVPKNVVFGNLLLKILSLLILVFSFVFTFIYALKLLFGSFVEETKHLKTFAKTEYKEVKSLSEKLVELVTFFSSININESIEKMADEMLKYALKVIDSGNAGSVIIKNGDKYTYVAEEGYGRPLTGKFFTSKEMVPAKNEKPFVIKHIYEIRDKNIKREFRKETRKLLKDIGTEKIRATIEAPFILDGEYYGGIFIDNFQSEDAFTGDDLKIAEAISKLGTLFLKSKNTISLLEETERKLFIIIDAFSKINLAMEEKEFLGNLLSIGKLLITASDAGSIMLKKGEYFKYIATFGYKEELRKLELKADNSYKLTREEATIVKDIIKYNEELLPPEEKEIILKAGGDRVKQTIVAPIIVNNEYMGGIFLDSFKEGNVFTKRDVEIATALSKLSSVFVEMKLAYRELETLDNFNKASLSLFHRISIKSAKEDVIKNAFEIIYKIYPNEVEEIAVGEKTDKHVILIKYNGSVVSSIPISPSSIEIAIKGRRSIFIPGSNQGTGRKNLAQAIVYSNTASVPIFRVRFNKQVAFSEQEKGFIERFGREIIGIYQSVSFYSKIKRLFVNYIFSIGNAVSSYDPYTEWHSTRVAYFSLMIAEKLKLPLGDKGLLLFSAVLHDVGKIAVPREILLKPGNLTKEEFKVIKHHPIEGEKIVSPMNPEAAKIIRHHHERWDGTGYPDGLKDGEIPLLSRIITVVDVFDALTTNRPYRKAFSFEKAMEVMISERGKAFDPHILDVFLTIPKETLKIKEINRLTIERMEEYMIEI